MAHLPDLLSDPLIYLSCHYYKSDIRIPVVISRLGM